MIATVAPRYMETPPTPPAIGDRVSAEYNKVEQALPGQVDAYRADPLGWGAEAVTQSSAMKTEFMAEVSSVVSIPKTAEACQEAALKALTMGLMSGALDAVLVMGLQGEQGEVVDPELPNLGGDLPSGEEFNGMLRELREGMLDLAKTDAGALGEVTEQLKSAGITAVEEAGQLAEYGELLPKEVYQGYLMATFAMGYATAAAMATDYIDPFGA